MTAKPHKSHHKKNLKTYNSYPRFFFLQAFAFPNQN